MRQGKYKAELPPKAEKVETIHSYHGQQYADPYHWLKNKSSAQVIEYLNAENRYTQQFMRDTEKLQQELFQEMVGRIKEDDISAKVPMDDYFYYHRSEKGKEYAIHCRKHLSLDAAEEIILDENKLAAGNKYFKLGALKVSRDHSLLAYSVDNKGDETHTIFILDLKSGELLSDQIEMAYQGLEWSNDGKRIYYTLLNSSLRPYRLMEHKLGQASAHDRLIYEECDEAYYLGLGKTKSKAYITICLRNQVSTEVRYFSADEPDGEVKLFQERRPNIEYYIEHQPSTTAETFFIMTNDGAKNFRIMKTDGKQTSHSHWEECVPGSDQVTIDDFELFQNHLVIYDRLKGLPSIRVCELIDSPPVTSLYFTDKFESSAGGTGERGRSPEFVPKHPALPVRGATTFKEHRIDFPDPVYAVVNSDNPNYHSSTLRFVYSSLAVPETIFDYDMKERVKKVVKEMEVFGGFDKANYRTERLFATSEDGTSIPISLVYRKDFQKDGRHPLVLRGYGAYGLNHLPEFSSVRISLVDRGFAYAIAHVRGGGTLGRAWYEAGKLKNKKNTFSDFISCASFLVENGYTKCDRLVGTGASAGGLLIGAVANMRPDLFKVMVAQVPFVDVTHTMMDPTLPLTVIEYDEWGNPNDSEFFDYIRSYSPYDNVAAQNYPHILATAGLNDPRVAYWEPAKWVARLRELKTDANILLLKTEMEAGHFSVSGRYQRYKDVAFEYAFILKVLQAVPR